MTIIYGYIDADLRQQFTFHMWSYLGDQPEGIFPGDFYMRVTRVKLILKNR